jgi:hypothetical protein
MPKITCYQCHQTFVDLEPFCPHCGAVRKENRLQMVIRMARRALIGGAYGAAIGTPSGLGLGIIFHLVKKQQEGRWYDTLLTMALIGLVIGGLLGAATVLIRDIVREE